MGLSATDYIAALPEIVLLGAICVLLVAAVFLRETRDAVLHYGSLLTIAVMAIITGFLLRDHQMIAWHGNFIQDGMGDVLLLFCYAITGAVLVYSRPYLKERGLLSGEFYVLMLMALLGAMVLIQAYSMLVLYLGVELLAISMYALVALSRDDGTASEAAMKFFVLGAISAGALLFGMSWIYGLSGTLNIGVLSAQLVGSSGTSIGLWVGLGFVILAMAFELGAVPFHMWLPDVYEGAPSSMVAFIGSVPKIAAFAFFMRLLVEGLGPLHDIWMWLLTAMAVGSLTIGAIVAIAQPNIKRMLAYSTINHAGFILLGILAGNALGYRAAMFYTLAYVIMFVGAFGVIILMSRSGFEADMLDDFKGLNERSPWYAFVMLMMMLSMAGIPPFIGFFAKLEVIRAVLDVNMTWLAVYAVIMAVIAAFYYLRIVKLMYFDHAEDKQPAIKAPADLRLLLSVNGLAVLGLGLFPGGLLALCGIVFGI
ncbi:MAG: NADH-quinone oxidoreductase subunit NuoN [Gammaproteobacteria bacterium]|nr:NADH-quinone oxidoreductase subunit NuoN [Gammaproteobacteria bacterium]